MKLHRVGQKTGRCGCPPAQVWLWVMVLAVLLRESAPADADPGPTPGVTAQAIRFGQSAVISGEAGALGRAMRDGIRAAFEEANRGGGIAGRRLVLITYDDHYEPDAAIANVHRLIREDQVFALIGAVGTPTARATAPIAALGRVPFIAPFTGAGFLRDDAPSGTVINLRASYDQEVEAITGRLVDRRGMTRLAVLYQDDSFGRAGLSGMVEALARRGLQPVDAQVYPRNTLAVRTGLLRLSRLAPEAVLIVGAYRPTAAAVLWARKIGFQPLFATLSFVGGEALAQELGPAGGGVLVTQVVPFPLGDHPPVVPRFRAALAAAVPDTPPGFVALEGYLAGRLAIAALARSAEPPTRAGFMAELRRGERIDLDGVPLSFGPDDNQGSDQVYLTVIDADGRLRPLAAEDQP